MVLPRLPLLRAALAGAALTLAASPAAFAQLDEPPVLPASGGAHLSVDKHPAGAPAELSHRLAQLAQPSVRGLAPSARAQRLAVPDRGPGSLVQAGGDVVVRVRGDERLNDLRAAGARILDVTERLGLVTAAIAPADLDAVARVPGVASVTPELAPISSAAGATPECHGSVTSEADTLLHAADAREAFGVTGAGVKVGVISDSFNGLGGAAHDVATGDLPGTGNSCGRTTPVQVLADSGGTDEGRAMAQVVHDLAPDAALAFLPAVTEGGTAQGIANLANAGANVIVDDITFLDEPYFQEGFLAATADAAVRAGIPYFSSAANNNVIIGGADRASWEAPSFRPLALADCPTLPAGVDACMNTGTAAAPGNAQGFGLAPGRRLTIDLQWAEPWFGVDTDLDLFLFTQTGTLLASAVEDNLQDQMPFELLSYTNQNAGAQDVFLVIGRAQGDGTPRLKWNLLRGSGSVTAMSPAAPGDIVGPSIFGHNGGEQVMSVAAVPFNNPQVVEPYSSRGPVTHYLGPVTSSVPADPLPSAQSFAKPDVAAVDGAATSFFGEPDGPVFRFFGTSEAAPHAAAVAALQKQFVPGATAAQIMNAQTSTAVAVGGFGAPARGAGLVNALAALPATRGTGGGGGGGGSAPGDGARPGSGAGSPAPNGGARPGSPAPTVRLTLRGRTLTLKISGAVTKASVTIKRGGRVVARGSGRVKRGKLTLRLKRRLAKGRYSVAIVLTGAGGQKTTMRKTLKV